MEDRRAETPVGEKKKWLDNQSQVLMVVATVIIAVALQAAVGPPGGVWQNDKDKLFDSHGNVVAKGHVAGSSILADKSPIAYARFIVADAFVLIASASIMLMLIIGLPVTHRCVMWVLTLIMRIVVAAIMSTFLISTLALIPPTQHRNALHGLCDAVIVWFCIMFILFIRFTVLLAIKAIKKLRRMNEENNIVV